MNELGTLLAELNHVDLDKVEALAFYQKLNTDKGSKLWQFWHTLWLKSREAAGKVTELVGKEG